MKKIAFAVLSLAALASASAFAEGKTRAQVYQELIEAQHNGLDYVTDASYPDVSPVFQQRVAQLKLQNNAFGPDMPGSSASGKRAHMPGKSGDMSCVGPVSFCTPYFGS
jgi:hypothetical protein